MAGAVFGTLKELFKSRRVGKHTKDRVLLIAVSSVLFYGADSWALHKADRNRLRRFWNNCVRTSAGIAFERKLEGARTSRS